MDLSSGERVGWTWGHYEWLLESAVTDLEMKVDKLPLSSAPEWQQMVEEWNQTAYPYPRRCVHELFQEQVVRAPEAVAVVFEDERLTYQELNRRANQLAHYLRKQGVGPETLVGICMERSVEMIVGVLGVLKAGGAYVSLDPAYPRERLAFMLQDSHSPILLTERRVVAHLPEYQDRVVCLDIDRETIAGECEADLTCSTGSRNLAYVIYTSGSTGTPKGVAIPHGNLANLVAWHRRVYEVTSADRATLLSSPGFDASVWEVWPYLAAGASLHIPSDEIRSLVPQLIDWLVSEGITISFLPTPLAEMALEAEWPSEVALRILLTGGDKLHHGPRPGLPYALINNYGPTENTVVTTWTPVEVGVPGSPPIGRPVDNVQVYLLGDQLRPVPAGAPGELYIGGDGLARGYLNRPDLTADKFIPDDLSGRSGARLYKTGDRARYLPDGNIEFLGRTDHQVKVRGFRIELGEIEAALSQHPAIRQAVVEVRENVSGDKRLAAYLVVSHEHAPAINELRGFLGDKLPEYMIPSSFVILDALPLTPSGKVDRRALPAPDLQGAELDVPFVAPRTRTEERVAEIWIQVLAIKRVGIHDNFFLLGGNSLTASQVISRVRDVFQKKVSLRSLFEKPTVAGLATVIHQDQAEARVQPSDRIRRVTGEQDGAEDVLGNLQDLSESEVDLLLGILTMEGQAR